MAKKKKLKMQPTPEMNQLLRRAGSVDHEIARAAQRELAKALTTPLKQGVLKGDIIAGIFEPINFQPGASVEFPLDFLSPGSEKDFVAYTIPNVGRLPERHVEGDYIMVPTYDVGASIDTSLKYLRDARWDVMGRMMQVLEAMFVRKANDDGWHAILGAGVGRNLVVSDDVATPGLFTKRLVALMQTIMRRNAGGNSTSLNRGKLTDLYISPEAHQDVLSWDLTQIPDSVRQQIFSNWENGGLARIGSVTLHDLDELGVGQEYELYFENVLGGTLPSTGGQKLEVVIGLDLSKNDSFVMPIRAEVEVFEDPTFHRQRRAGVYGWGEHGFSILDNRRVLLGAL
jgi:hypothetical protein